MKLLLIVCMLCNAVPRDGTTVVREFSGTPEECLRLAEQISAASLETAVVVCGPIQKQELVKIYGLESDD